VAKFLIAMMAPEGKTYLEAVEEHTGLLQRAGFSKIRHRHTTYADQDPFRYIGPNNGKGTEKFHWSAHGDDQNLTYLMLIARVVKGKAIRKPKKKTK
jgi:hypothetical protein